MHLQKNHKVLIVRFSSIGDIVLTSPVVRCIKEQAGASVHFITKKSYKSVVDANPNIDRVYSFEKKIEEILPLLKAEKYDCIIDLHKNIRSLKLRQLLGVKTLSFNKINIKKWLAVQFKISVLPDIHIVDRYLKTVESLGIKNDFKGLDFFISSENQLPLQHWTKGSGHIKNYIVFAIGAAHTTKRLPIQKMMDLIGQLKTYTVVLIGGSTERVNGSIIHKTYPNHTINLCGTLNIQQSAYIIQKAALVLTHDTGMMHIAAAFQKPIVSIWGNTIPEFGMYPYDPKGVHQNVSIEVKALKCRPCSKIGYQECPKKHFNCMQQINTTEIVAAIHTLLKK